ncbi:hypothetical protein BSLA_02f3631 [Burkholderia stabilis]|nr:hypothetical protein BSLA_02f3631 [Burkholderia stabilis]
MSSTVARLTDAAATGRHGHRQHHAVTIRHLPGSPLSCESRNLYDLFTCRRACVH